MFTEKLKTGLKVGDAVKLRNVPDSYGLVTYVYGLGFVEVDYISGHPDKFKTTFDGADVKRVEPAEVIKFLSDRIGALEEQDPLARAQSYFDKRMNQELPRQVQSYLDKLLSKRFPQKVEKKAKK